MTWAVLFTLIQAAALALWKPVTAYLVTRKLENAKDTRRALEVRRRADDVKEKYREGFDHLSDADLDRKLRSLRVR